MDSQKLFDSADGFTRAYIVCALWTGVEYPEGHEMAGRDKDYSKNPCDLDPATMESMMTDCAKFQKRAATIIAIADETGECKRGPDCDTALERAGHDFWLTRNGHGAGFWDGDWPEPYATQLDKLSKKFGESDLYTGDDGLIYGI